MDTLHGTPPVPLRYPKDHASWRSALGPWCSPLLDFYSEYKPGWVLSSLPTQRMQALSPRRGRTIWPGFSRKNSWVARPSVTLTARISICSQGPMFSSSAPTWLGLHSLQKLLLCQQIQDPERLIFLGQWRATSLKVYIIFSAWQRSQPPKHLSGLTCPWFWGIILLCSMVYKTGLPNPALDWETRYNSSHNSTSSYKNRNRFSNTL